MAEKLHNLIVELRSIDSLHAVILVQEEQDPNNGGFAVGAQPAEAVHVQQ